MRFWDKQKNEVVSRYLGSQFLGHTRANDLLECLVGELSALREKNLVQLSMDGPKTNWKLFDHFVQRRENIVPHMPTLLNLGSCSLHIVHGAFKTGAQATGWNIDAILRSMYYLFHDSPARSEDYLKIEGAKMPMKFCSTCWLEDAPVAERAIEIWPKVVKYIKEVEAGPKSKIPKIASFSTLRSATKDPLMPAKLQFFVTQANVLKPYLAKYQTQNPMAVFMAEDIYNLVHSLFSKFVKKEVLENANSMAKIARIELEKDENLVELKKVEKGFAVKALVEQVEKSKKVSRQQSLEFSEECLLFFKSLTLKLLDRNPLKYPVVRYISSLDPRRIGLDPQTALSYFEKLLANLLACRWLSAEECDEAKHEFSILLSEVNKYHTEAFKTKETERVDVFYAKLIGENKTYTKLWKVMKLVFVLSHGQADIERGFSVNKDILSCNMGEDTVTAYRFIFDGVQALGCNIHDIVVTKKMLESCRMARNRYKIFLDQQKEQKKTSEKEQHAQKLKEEVASCRKKQQSLETESAQLLDKADLLCDEAETKHRWNLLMEANALRVKGKQKRKAAEDAKLLTEEAVKKLKLCV